MNNNDEIIACPKCGTRLSSKTTFCGVCGYNFATNSSSNIVQNNSVNNINNDISTTNQNFTNNNSIDFVGEVFSAARWTFLTRMIGKIISFIILLIFAVIFLAENGIHTGGWIVLILVIVVLIAVVVILSKLKRR